MDLTNYPSNSRKSKEQDNTKRVEKAVASGKARKKNGVTKFADAFISEDIKTVKSYVFSEVLIPALQKLLVDTVNNSINMMVYGNEGKARSSNMPRVSYRSYDDRRDNNRARARSKYDFDDVIFDTRGDAETTLDSMYDILEKYQAVSVADLYDLAGLRGNHTDNKYGWTDLRGAYVNRASGGGYIVRLPRVSPLD